jgi:hypothetical protein
LHIVDSEKSEDTAANKPMDQECAGAPAPASSGIISQTRQFNAEPVNSRVKQAIFILKFFADDCEKEDHSAQGAQQVQTTGAGRKDTTPHCRG